MAFDVEGYRKAAKNAGLSDAEIQKDIDEETQGFAAKGADANMDNVKVGTEFMGIPEWLQPAVGLATAAVAGGLSLKGAQKLKERMSTPQQPAAARVEPTFGIPDIGPEAQPQSKFTPPQGNVTDVASRPVGDPRLQIGGPKALAAPVASVAPPAVPASPVSVAPVIPNAVQPTPDSLTKEQKGMKNYLVSQYGGGPEGEAAYKKTIDILGGVPAYEKGQGGGLSKEANDTIKAWRKENIEGPKVNLSHDMKKVMKGAGGVAALMALPGFAQAAQNKDMGKMSDIFTDFFVLPFAQSREAGIPKAEEESIIAGKFKEASKLGSPFRSIPPPR